MRSLPQVKAKNILGTEHVDFLSSKFGIRETNAFHLDFWQLLWCKTSGEPPMFDELWIFIYPEPLGRPDAGFVKCHVYTETEVSRKENKYLPFKVFSMRSNWINSRTYCVNISANCTWSIMGRILYKHSIVFKLWWHFLHT